MTDEQQSAPLSFEAAIPVGGASAGVRCVNCGKPIVGSYFTANGKALDDECRERIQAAVKGVSEPAVILKSLVFGIGAAAAGALVYWAVLKYAELEIGIVAILTGWLVGKAMRAGANGRGGLVLQLTGALLVYLSVAAAYLPFAMGDSAGSLGALGVVIALFTLPIFVILGSMPGGILSAIIIGIGMVQAWQLTGAPAIAFEGPFRIGGDAAPGAPPAAPPAALPPGQ